MTYEIVADLTLFLSSNSTLPNFMYRLFDIALYSVAYEMDVYCKCYSLLFYCLRYMYYSVDEQKSQTCITYNYYPDKFNNNSVSNRCVQHLYALSFRTYQNLFTPISNQFCVYTLPKMISFISCDM